jgi:hypothetical protein
MRDDFVQSLFGEDELGVVIRAHIYVEARLIEFLGLLVVDQDYLNKLDLEFSQCVDLAIALGLGQEHAKGLRAFGTLRNEFAHKLDSKLSENRIKSLYESFSASDKEIVQAAYVRTKSQVGGFGGSDVNFKDLDPKKKFILIAVAVHGMLEAAILKVRKHSPNRRKVVDNKSKLTREDQGNE